mmetsp:Transcript_74055/g.123684  ORF Transcript_74055/g.123684 Transcript_74055/m.123684 type:complete len:246 (+) Transcript_74055:116-853(+)
MRKKMTYRADGGMQVIQRTEGDGVNFPSPGDECTLHYVGSLSSNGDVFDSTRGKAPFSFKLGKGAVIQGWEMGVPKMSLGARATLMIPSALGYGGKGCVDKKNASGTGVIPPHADLVFDVELLDINGSRGVLALHNYQARLQAWMEEKLSKFDQDETARSKMMRKHGSRENYEIYLQRNVVDKLAASARENGWKLPADAIDAVAVGAADAASTMGTTGAAGTAGAMGTTGAADVAGAADAIAQTV